MLWILLFIWNIIYSILKHVYEKYNVNKLNNFQYNKGKLLSYKVVTQDKAPVQQPRPCVGLSSS